MLRQSTAALLTSLLGSSTAFPNSFSTNIFCGCSIEYSMYAGRTARYASEARRSFYRIVKSQRAVAQDKGKMIYDGSASCLRFSYYPLQHLQYDTTDRS